MASAANQSNDKKTKEEKKKEKLALIKLIQDYWSDPNSPAFMSGAWNLKSHLALEKKVYPKITTIYEALKNLETYITHIPLKPIKKHRRYSVSHQFELFEADLIFLPSYRGFTCALIVVDVFSNYLIVKALKNKKAKTVAKAFTQIFEGIRRLPEKLQTDKGN